MLEVNMKAFVLVSVQAGKVPKVLAALRRIDAVEISHGCWGRPDIFALVEVKNERALSDLVIGKVQPIVGIEFTETHIVIN
jgi:DNA-binding Lrp family transcriptional regulator